MEDNKRYRVRRWTPHPARLDLFHEGIGWYEVISR